MGLEDITNEAEIELEDCEDDECNNKAIFYIECATTDKHGPDRGFYCKSCVQDIVEGYEYNGVNI